MMIVKKEILFDHYLTNIWITWLHIITGFVGNGIELEAVGFQFEPYRWRHNETCLIQGRRDPNQHCDSLSKM